MAFKCEKRKRGGDGPVALFENRVDFMRTIEANDTERERERVIERMRRSVVIVE